MRVISDESIAIQYAQAREAQADNAFDEIIAIADTANPKTVAVAKPQIDLRTTEAKGTPPKTQATIMGSLQAHFSAIPAPTAI